MSLTCRFLRQDVATLVTSRASHAIMQEHVSLDQWLSGNSLSQIHSFTNASVCRRITRCHSFSVVAPPVKFTAVHVGSGLPAFSATIYAAYQSAQAASR